MTVASTVKDIGVYETMLRGCLTDLRILMYPNTQLEFDGDIITTEIIDKWEATLNEIDHFCYFK